MNIEIQGPISDDLFEVLTFTRPETIEKRKAIGGPRQCMWADELECDDECQPFANCRASRERPSDA